VTELKEEPRRQYTLAASQTDAKRKGSSPPEHNATPALTGGPTTGAVHQHLPMVPRHMLGVLKKSFNSLSPKNRSWK